ncbi:DUF1003 domain-containing protein [Alsobacter ponti]|uniref:DUF1003 domain-containing protein n=1 Tax=Alsobacter ponti TaxID=2962936 RepID=UPI0035307287
MTSPRARDRAADTGSADSNGLSSVLARNIQSLSERRRREDAQATREERFAAAITRFTGSMLFVYLHVAAVGFWLAANFGLIPGVRAWDDSFVMLGMMASVEAIFLSTFVMIAQNRMSAAADKRADLDLQISLLAEHEITRLASLLTAIAGRMGIDAAVDPEIREIERDVAPEAVLDEIEATREGPVEPGDEVPSGASAERGGESPSAPDQKSLVGERRNG